MDLEDGAAIGAVPQRPAGVQAGIATDELALVKGQAVRIAAARREFHDFDQIAVPGVQPGKAGMAAGIAGAVDAGDNQQRVIAGVIGAAMETVEPARKGQRASPKPWPSGADPRD